MSSGGLKPISIASPSPSLMGGAVGGVTTPSNSQQNSTNNDAKRDNPFLQFVANTRYCNIICGCGSWHLQVENKHYSIYTCNWLNLISSSIALL